MKWINRILAVGTVLTISAVAAVAQTPECTDEFKTATYTKWFENRTDHQDVAYEAAKEYVKVCPTDESQYATALKNFIDKYEKLKATQNVASQFEAAVKNKNYADQIKLGKQIVATNPENAAVVYIIMASAGLGDPNLLPDSAQAAKKAIELIEAGKPFAPAYKTKDQALAAMNYIIAKATVKTSPTDAIPYFIKAAKYDSDLKKSALLYNELAAAYGEGPVAKLTEDYKAKIGQPETTESKLIILNLNQAIDRQIDALARAAALSTNPADKKAIMDVLTGLYKDRNKSETGLPELVASVLSKPLPDPPTPITNLPATTQTSTPAGAGSATGSPVGAAPTTNTGAKPATNNTAGGGPARGSATSTGTQSGGAAKPAASPTPKPRSRRTNHRA